MALAAAQGGVEAQCMLGVMNFKSDGGTKDLAEATRIFRLAAEQGNTKAQVILGSMHYEGKGGPPDFAEARRLLGLAAAQGQAKAHRPSSATCTKGRKTLPRRSRCPGSLQHSVHMQHKTKQRRSACSARCTSRAKVGR